MSGGLSISDVVTVQVVLSPLPVAQRNFGSLVIIGPTEGVINTSERMRTYATIAGVAADFGTTVPEYLAANLYFEQAPQPAQVLALAAGRRPHPTAGSMVPRCRHPTSSCRCGPWSRPAP